MLTEVSKKDLFEVHYRKDGSIEKATVLKAGAVKTGDVYELPDGVLPFKNDLRERFASCCMSGAQTLLCNKATTLALIMAGIIPDNSIIHGTEVVRPGIKKKGVAFPGVPTLNTSNATVTVVAFDLSKTERREFISADQHTKQFSWK